MADLPLAVRRPKLVLLIWLGVVVLMGTFISGYPKININPTVKSMIRSDDPDLAFDTDIKKRLGDDEMLVVVIEHPRSVFDIPTLQYIDRLTKAIEQLPQIRKVYSLTHADNIRARGGMLVSDPLMREVPHTQEELAVVEKEAFENPTYVNMIVAPDKKVASINIELNAGHTTEDDNTIVEKIYDIIDASAGTKPPEVKTHYSGFPLASYLGAHYMIQDMFVFSGGSLVLLTIIMFLVLRSWHGVAFTLFVSTSSVNVVYGLMSLLGFQVTTPLSSMMAFMTAIGMEYSVYVAFAYQYAVQTGTQGRDKRVALADALKDVRFTVIMSAACTTAAFASITTNPLHDLKVMGAFLAIGTLTCCTAALTIIPAWISLFSFPVPTLEKARHRWLQKLIDKIGHADTRRPYVVLGALAVLCAGAIALITQMHSDIDAFQYFRKGSTIRQDHEFIRSHMAGDAMIPLVVATNQVDAFKDPENLHKLDDLARFAQGLEHVSKVVSHADHIKLMNEALQGGGSADYKLPSSRQAVEQYLLLHNSPDDFHAWIDPDYKTANVMLRVDTLSSSVLFDNEAKLKDYGRRLFPNADVRVVGTTLLVARAVDTISVSLVTGVFTAAVLIWLIMCIGFRSIRIGTLALIPTLPPALCVYATLPLIGHALDPPTSITGTIALGIAIDDTTWFLATWVSRRRRAGSTASGAVSETLSAIGRPMILSSMVLGSGFLIMLFSRYGTLFWLGVMMTIVAFWSILWDVLCTPTIVYLFDPKLPKRSFGHEITPPK